MAVATTTALAIAGTVAAVGGSVGSFAQASKAKKDQQRAEREATKAIDRARSELGVNYYDELAIAKQPYELAREQLAQQSADAMNYLAEGDPRGLGAGVGRVQANTLSAIQKQRADMESEIQRIEQLRSAQEIKLQEERVDMDIEEAKGAQIAAREAEYRRQQAIQQGVAGVVDAGMGAIESFAPLFPKKPETPTFDINAIRPSLEASIRRNQFAANLASVTSNPFAQPQMQYPGQLPTLNLGIPAGVTGYGNYTHPPLNLQIP
jgi:hypothetical protein